MRRLIGITPEQDVFCEQRRITNMLRSGEITYFHIRKPHYTEKMMRDYLFLFDADVKERLSLHDFHYLASELGIGGIHLNKRNPELKEEYHQKRISVSCHTIEEVQKWKDKADYLFLSPTFDSISKQGYTSKFDLQELKALFEQNILNEKVCALGGVTYNNIDVLKQAGFSSFAMLSTVWYLPKTMFISHTNEFFDYYSSCKAAIEGGIKFVQLRMKDAADDEVINTAKQLRPLCDKHACMLTVNDRIHLLDTNLFDGVHLGKNDMPIKQAKVITKGKYLLGATCNTIKDVFNAIDDGADYLGIGPYRYTQTKKNLSPVLGIAGYNNIMEQLSAQNINIPTYAIGGITTEDLQVIKSTNIYGVAVSSAVINTPQNTQERINKFLKIF